MVSQPSVALVSKEAETARAVSAALGAGGGIALSGVCGDLSQLTVRMEKSPTPAVLVDISSRPVEMLAELGPIIERFSEARFVVLGDGLRQDLVFEAMQIGARYFLLKESIPTNLANIVGRLIVDGSSKTRREGIVTTILSGGGGCGSTTLAVNIADELQLMTAEPVLLVDADCAYGSVATYLGISGRYGIADVLDHDGCIDQSLIGSSAVGYSKNLHVLISPASVNISKPRPLQWDNLTHVLKACKQAYAHTVIDAPRVSLDAAANFAHASAMTIICFQLTVKDIRLARAVIGGLEDRNVPLSSLLPLANRYRKRGPMIGLTEATEALGGMKIWCVANDLSNALKVLNYGQPLSRVAPRSVLRKDVCSLAARISQFKRSYHASSMKHDS